MLEYEYFNRWDIVIVDITIFSVFLLSLSFRNKHVRRVGGLYLGFITSLFFEMYGIPLTVYMLSAYFGGLPYTYWRGHLLGVLGFVLGFAILAFGLYLIVAGWKAVYLARGRLVESGVYGLVRHPQYLGFILVTLGWLIHWPTLITSAIWPFLTVSYYRLAKEEEASLEATFKDEYREYAEKVPMFIPKMFRLDGIIRNFYAAYISRN
ncbi:MAG: isoprenylcysteine carboxylmethyltransferase family protein [Candidatus Bathyarchaeia archaeon]